MVRDCKTSGIPVGLGDGIGTMVHAQSQRSVSDGTSWLRANYFSKIRCMQLVTQNI